MKTFYSCILISFFAAAGAKAQSFEFLENKGQWNSEVLFKGEIANGAFFLKTNGYRVVQHHPAEFNRIKDVVSGHAHGPENQQAAGQDYSLDKDGLPAEKAGDEEVLVLHSHAYDVQFEGARSAANIRKLKPVSGHFNYFIGNDSSRWAGGVQAFGEVWMQEIYPGIDVRYYSEDGFLKYDFIVQPYAAVDKLVLKYIGAESLSLSKGDLLVKTSVNVIREKAPYSYQLENGVRRQVSCRYDISGQRVSFRLSGYDQSQPLVIDPLVFASFTGSTSDNWGYTATYDAAGNLYAGGISFATGYPVTPGAFQTTYRGGNSTGESGGFDIAITKFNSTGTQRLYATYLGGTGNEQPHSLVADRAGNLIMAGRTNSSNYPVTTAFIGEGNGGMWDIVVTKLNPAGSQLAGSVRLGGAEDDGVNIKHKYASPGAYPVSLQQNYGDDARSEVVLDAAGNILVASCSRSPRFPVTGGAFQKTLSGSQDGLLLKFNESLNSLLFSTFLGGSGEDAAYVLALSPAGNIYVGGGTTSTDFPGQKAGTVGPSYFGGLADGFLAEIAPDASAIIRSAYFGTSGTDQVYGVQFDRQGFVYIMGTSTGNFPVNNAAFSQAGGKQFIAKLNTNLGAFVYSTVFGTPGVSPNISPTAFLVDRCENVYVSGWGGRVLSGGTNPPFQTAGTQGLTITPDAIQRQTDGKDFYFFVLAKDAASQLFGSYFGQLDPPGVNSTDHVDGGTSRFDANGAIYQGVCANCGGGQFPTTTGVVGPSNPSGRCNQAVIKINFDLAGVKSGIKSSIGNQDGDTSDCAPTTIQFRDTINQAKSYEWDFGDGSPSVNSVDGISSHTYTAPGIYRARMIAVDSTKCYPRDTTYVTIRIREDVAPVLASATKLQPCESNRYQFNNLSVPYPGKPFQSNSFTWIFGDNSPPVTAGIQPVTHQYAGPGTYQVKLVITDTNYCNAPDTFSLTLRVSPLVSARFNAPDVGCTPFNAVFENTSLGGQQFLWQFGDGTTSTAANPSKTYAVPGIYTVKLIAIDSSACNIIDSTVKTIRVSSGPVSAFSFTPDPPLENIFTTFINQSSLVPRYKWQFGDGDSLLTFRRDTVVRHQYRQTGTYSACLIAINEFGCPDTTCRPIPAVINPLLDVVTAFTPNGDGNNDRAIILGYGIGKIIFRIYNRWGQLMFETSDPRVGWDGTFQGKPQPMDAYGYTIEGELVSGEKFKRSGNITLIR